jgi:DNA-binding XRE family transcriptional regulator
MGKTKLYDKMQEKGITNKQMANYLVGFNAREETVFQWVDGRRVPTARVKKAIAKILDCKVSDIF